MKELVLNYEDTEQLELVIESTYFIKGNFGKKGDNVDYLNVKSSDTLYTILNGLEQPRIKIKNSSIIGTLICDVIQNDERVTLRPSSSLCVKEHNKYTFY